MVDTVPGGIEGGVEGEVEPLAWLLGEWAGEGRGSYPTIDPFTYREETSFVCPGKPFVAYSQRTWTPDGSPLHSETGYLRPRGEVVEAVVAEPLGSVEIYAGVRSPERLELTSTLVATTPTAKSITALRRTFWLEGELLRYEVEMAAVGQPLQFHLEAVLRRA